MKIKYHHLRTLEWLLITLFVFFSFKYTFSETENYIQKVIFVPSAPIVHVDQQYSGGFQNGSYQFPFTRIQKAIDFCKSDPAFNTILVNSGEYFESLQASDNLKIFGVGGKPVIMNPRFDKGKTIVAGDNLVLANLEIRGGNYGIYIPSNKTVTIYEIAVKYADIYGIANEKHEHTESAKLSAVKCTVSMNEQQGLYLRKGAFYFNNLLVNENGEEGIDFHEETTSKITNTTIIDNGEGGIETELGNVEMKIENSTIERNKSSGINIQSFGDNSKVDINNCVIKDNSDFGVRCAIHTRLEFPYFSRMLRIAENNTITGNGKRQIDLQCYK